MSDEDREGSEIENLRPNSKPTRAVLGVLPLIAALLASSDVLPEPPPDLFPPKPRYDPDRYRHRPTLGDAAVDQAALDAAEAKRQRKAAKRLRDAARVPQPLKPDPTSREDAISRITHKCKKRAWTDDQKPFVLVIRGKQKDEVEYHHPDCPFVVSLREAIR